MRHIHDQYIYEKVPEKSAYLNLVAHAKMYSMWIQFCLYDFGQMAVIVIALCVLIFYLLKWTNYYQHGKLWLKAVAIRLKAKLSNRFASLFQMMRNVNSKTSLHRYKSTPETTNLARVARLILGPCTDLLRDILKRKIPPSNLSKTVKTWIDDLKKKKLKNPLNKQQVDDIFPLPTKQYGGDYSNFDISLLYILLRNVCKIPPHNKGWGKEPDPTDNSVSANIERIRLTRNKYYGHAADFSLTQSNFIREWQNIYNITVELEQHIGTLTVYQDAVNEIRTCSMDPEIEAKYIDKLLLIDELCETVKSHSEEIKKLQQDDLPNVKDEIKKLQHVIPRNVKDLHEVQLMQWRVEDEVYSETHTFPEMLNKVRGQPYMTFVGAPGSGKSATIHHIALILQKEGYEIAPIIDIRKIEDYIDSRHPQVFVIDDVVGVLGLQKQKFETLVDYEKIISDPSRHTKVLMSCREAVFNECYESFFLNEDNIVKMCSSENTLAEDDKKAILQKHGLDKDLLSPTLLREASAMFPLLCKLYSREEKFRNNVERFFTCPARYILEELDKMQKQNRLQYATLVLCLLNDNTLSNKILKDTGNKIFCEMKSKALEICKVKSYTDAFEFVDALSVMEGTYTKQCGTEYTFFHDSMFEIIAYHFGSKFPHLILQFTSSSYIANYVKLQIDEMLKLENEHKQTSEKAAINSGIKNEEKIIAHKSSQKGEKGALSAENGDRMESFDLCIRIGENQYSLLAERLYKDIENMELYDVFMNNILKHPKVCHAFIEVLKTKPYTELKSLFLSEQKDVSKVVSKGERVTEEIEKVDERSRESNRQRLLVNEKCDKTEITYSVRVISWVVYYGHKRILQYILEQTECHKETQSELFFNFFKLALLNPTKEEGNRTAANDAVEKLRSFIDLDIDGSISEHLRLLELSCYNGDLETVKTFIEYFKKNTICTTFPDSEFKYVLGDEALKAACRDGHLSVVKELVEAGANVNPWDVLLTPLTAACVGGHMSVVKELIEAGADINKTRSSLYTPLAAACMGGHMSVVKELIEAGADINQKDMFDTPLAAACMGGHMSVVKELIEAGADINQKGHYLFINTPLMAACNGGYISIVKELLEAGAEVNLKGKHGIGIDNETPLIVACKGGHFDIVKELLVKGADVNQEGKNFTPLTAACKGGRTDLVKELLEAGADVNVHSEIDSPLTAAIKGGNIIIVKELLRAGTNVNPQNELVTPLIVACEGGDESFVKELLDEGADVNLHSTRETPLIAACYCGHLSIVMQLLKAGADVNLQIKSCTSLIAACWGGHEDVVEEIVKAGVDVNLHGHYYKSRKVGGGKELENESKSYTPLTLVCWGGSMNGVKTLLKAGADINPQGEYSTPLIAAIEVECIRIIKELLCAGAEVNLQGKHKTPLVAACDRGHMEIVMELLNVGADVNLHRKDDCNTPLSLACKKGHTSIVIELLKAGADVNLQWGDNTPLTAACDEGHLSIVRELLSAGADVNLQGKHNTPLTAACHEGHLSIVRELLSAGADVNLQGKHYTPLMAACGEGHTSIAMELLKAGADVNPHGEDVTPLTIVCKNGYMNIAKKLLNAGSYINMQDWEGNTPLYTAIVTIHKTFFPVIARMFDFYGADSTIRNNNGISAFYIALIRNSSVKQLLRTEDESKLNRLRLHLFECLVDIRHSDVMTDSKDDVVVTRRRVWYMEEWGDLYKAIRESDCKGLKYLLRVGLDVNQWIKLYYGSLRPLLFTLIDENICHESLLDMVRILLESGVDVNVRVRYEEYGSDSVSDIEYYSVLDREYYSVVDRECGSVLDREEVSVLGRTRQLLNKYRKREGWKTVFNCTRVIKEVKKHVRRYSV